MGPFKIAAFALLTCSLPLGCMQHHEARVQTALLPPPSATPVQHTGRLWVELGEATWENQCRTPQGQRLLCFEGVRRQVFGALERGLWTSFPQVALRDGEALQPGDYRLLLDVTLNAVPPDADGPGWSAVAAGSFRLQRDGETLHEERLGSRSRAAFAYGGALGVAAGEVVDAFAAHVALVLGGVTEDRPLRAAPLPPVVVEVLTPVAAPAPNAALAAEAPAPLNAAPPAAAGPVPASAPTSEPVPTTPIAIR